MPRITSELVVRLLDQVTGPARAAARALGGIGKAQDAANRGSLGDRIAGATGRAEERMNSLRGSMLDAVGAGYALKQAITAPIAAAMEFESAMADVRKVVDFPTPQGFKDLQRDLLEMSKRIPVSVTGLAAITAAAGQAGISGKELLPFVEGAAKVGTAFDISADQAGEALAKMRAGLGITNEEVFSLADAMNHLSNAQASSAAEILDVVRGVGAQAKTFGFNAVEVSAFASAMISAGAQSDVATTSFRNMGLALTKGGNATETQRKAFGRLGLDSIKVAKNMQKDAVGTTLDVMKRIGKLPDYMRAELASALFGNEARALGPLLTNLPLLETSLRLVSDATLYAGSTQKEFEARSATTANAVQLFKNQLGALSITIGAALIPAMNEIMQSITPMVSGMTRFAEAHPVLTRNVIAATSGLVALRIAAIGLRFATGMSALGLLTMAGNVTKLGSGLRAAIAIGFSPFVAAVARLRTGLITLGMVEMLAGRGAAFRAFGMGLLGVLNPLRLVTASLQLLKVAVIGTGIGAVLVGIALAGTWIYNNWQGIGTAFEAFKGAFDRAIAPIRPAIEPVIGIFRSLFETIGSITGQVDPLGGKWAALGISIGEKVGGALVAAVQGVRDFIAAVTGIVGTIAAVPGQIQALFAGIDLAGAGAAMIASFAASVREGLAGMAAWVKAKLRDMFTFNVSMPSWLGGAGAAASDSAAAEAGLPGRATGGPVSKGQSYWVGEQGIPEVFTPGASGFITPMDKLGGSGKGSAAGAGGGSFTYSPTYTIGKVEGVADLKAILAQHDRDAQAKFESMMDGSFADN